MTDPPADPPGSAIPFPSGRRDFGSVRELFEEAGYTEAGIGARMGIADVSEFVTVREGRQVEGDPSDPLDLLVRLFLDGDPMPRAQAESLLRDGVEELESAGLLREHPDRPGAIAATVRLYPVQDVLVVSDLTAAAPGVSDTDGPVAPDHVYPASAPNTRTFLSMLPESRCERFLELCAGTGIAALLHARRARQAWATDIAERSTRFAEFNARLNGIGNFEALRGDLYEPVFGRRFDRIAAHPPYLPAEANPLIYAHAGEDGEDVLRGILAGLPEHLEQGGRFYATCRATDRVGRPLEARIREMIGPEHTGFDVLIVSHYALHPTEYYSRQAAAGRVSFAFVEQRHLLYLKHEVEAIVYASLVVQRHAGSRAPFTIRRERGEAASAEVEWLLDWATAVAEGAAEARLLDGRPVLSQEAKLHTVHRVEAGEWSPDSFRIRTERPFPRSIDASLNLAIMLTIFDGSVSGREALDRLRGSGALSADVPDTSYLELLQRLVEEGVLRLAGSGTEGAPERRA